MYNKTVNDFMDEIADIRSMFEEPEGANTQSNSQAPQPTLQRSQTKDSGTTLPKLEEFVSSMPASDPRRKFVVSAQKLAECLLTSLEGFRGGVNEDDDGEMFGSIDDAITSVRNLGANLTSLAKVAQFAANK